MRTKAPDCCQIQHECNAQFLFVDTIEDGGENICKKSLNSISISSEQHVYWLLDTQLQFELANN